MSDEPDRTDPDIEPNAGAQPGTEVDVAGQQQRDQFVADLAVRQGFSVLIPGIEQELGDIVTAAVVLASPLRENLVERPIKRTQDHLGQPDGCRRT